MAVRYSYDDSTTKGHGVIEGEFYYVRKSGKPKNKPKKVPKANKKNELKSILNHLTAINSRADAERRAQAYAERNSVNAEKKSP
jgi:hypothetical protein